MVSIDVPAYDEYEVSPYEELEFNLMRNIEMSRMASIVAGRALFFFFCGNQVKYKS